MRDDKGRFLKGFKPSAENIERIRQMMIGNKYRLGKKFSSETIEKLSQCHKGRKAWNKGKHHTEESKKKIGRSGHNNAMWKGGRRIDKRGYVLIYKPDHHFANMSRAVLEHRSVWEEYHKAVLLPWSNVHHINGDKQDNRIENLEAMMKGQHSRITLATYNKFWIPKQLCIELGITSDNIIEKLKSIQ